MPSPKQFNFLPISIQLETQGGVATPLLRRGIPLPTQRTHTFTTAADDQTSVEARVVVGESPLVAQNVSLGTARLTDIPRAKRGQATIKIVVSVDKGCSTSVRAEVDKGQSVEEAFPLFETVTEEQIEQLVSQAASRSVEDQETARSIDRRLRAEQLIIRADIDVRERRASGTATKEDELIEKAIADLGIALAGEDTTRIEPLTSALEKRLQARTAAFDAIFSDMFANLSPFRTGQQDSGRVHAGSNRRESTTTPTRSSGPTPAASTPISQATDHGRLFVVHGRNERIRLDFFAFLRALGLHPLEWSEAIALTGKPTPYIGEVLDAAFRYAQAVAVLLTPDDEVRLAPELWRDGDGRDERENARQPRANVLFEAGMAIARDERRTVLIEVGAVKSFSDIAGRHVIKLNNSPERRSDVAERLRMAGCSVSTKGRDWLSIGAFTV